MLITINNIIINTDSIGVIDFPKFLIDTSWLYRFEITTLCKRVLIFHYRSSTVEILTKKYSRAPKLTESISGQYITEHFKPPTDDLIYNNLQNKLIQEQLYLDKFHKKLLLSIQNKITNIQDPLITIYIRYNQ